MKSLPGVQLVFLRSGYCEVLINNSIGIIPILPAEKSWSLLAFFMLWKEMAWNIVHVCIWPRFIWGPICHQVVRLSLTARPFTDLIDVSLVDEDNNSISTNGTKRAMWQCKFHHMVAYCVTKLRSFNYIKLYETNASIDTCFPKLEQIQVAPPGGQNWNHINDARFKLIPVWKNELKF